MARPLVIELFAGRFGWSRGFVADGWRSIGFDIAHEPYHGAVPEGCDLVLQDVLTLDGAQFRNADAIVASPPCQKYSYMAQPWKRAKREIAWQKWERDSPFGNYQLTALFDACSRIQYEACAASGRHIPMVIENVRGAQPWVGRAKAHYGSYYLWGDVPALMPWTSSAKVSGMNWSGSDKPGYRAVCFRDEGARQRKNSGGSWFGVAHNTESGVGQNPVNGVKQHGSGAAWFDKALDDRRREATATKNGGDWFGSGENCSLQRRANSRSNSRKAASAMIAEIPLELAKWIARCFKPG